LPAHAGERLLAYGFRVWLVAACLLGLAGSACDWIPRQPGGEKTPTGTSIRLLPKAEPSETVVPEPPVEQIVEAAATPTARSATPYGVAAADVIRTRLARRERQAQAAPPATPIPPERPATVVCRGGVVSAARLGLMWMDQPVGVLAHSDALVLCPDLSHAGCDDWRMPTIHELEAVVRAQPEPDWTDPVQVLWSTTPHDPRGVRVVDLVRNEVSHQATGMAHVLCVRDMD